MNIISTSTLTKEQEGPARQLVMKCQVHDETFKEPYLSNMLNFDKEMPAFFLAMEGEDLVGLLAVYADTKEVEVSLFVAPACRRQGIARALYQQFLAETAAYQLEGIEFISERVFLEKVPGLLESWGVEVCDGSEYLLERGRQAIQVPNQAGVTVELATADQVTEIAQLKASVFETDLEMQRTYVREAIEDQESLLYVAMEGNRAVGVCTVDISTKDNYLYGLAVASDRQGQGIGTFLTAFVLADLLDNSDRPFQIAVDADNPGAKALYEKLGFETKTEILYLQKKEG